MSFSALPSDVQAFGVGPYLPTDTLRSLSRDKDGFRQMYLDRIRDNPVEALISATEALDVDDVKLIIDTFLDELQEGDLEYLLQIVVDHKNLDILRLLTTFDLDIVLGYFLEDPSTNSFDFSKGWMIYTLALEDPRIMQYLLDTDTFPGLGSRDSDTSYQLLITFMDEVQQRYGYLPSGFYSRVWRYLTRREDSIDLSRIRSSGYKHLLQYLLDVEPNVQ